MSLNFLVVNLNCFLFFVLTTTYGYFVSPDQTGEILLSELILSYYGLCANLVLMAQALIYPRGKN